MSYPGQQYPGYPGQPAGYPGYPPQPQQGYPGYPPAGYPPPGYPQYPGYPQAGYAPAAPGYPGPVRHHSIAGYAPVYGAAMAYGVFRRKVTHRSSAELAKAAHMTVADIESFRRTFHEVDRDRSGTLERPEFERFWRDYLRLPYDPAQISFIFDLFDVDRSGRLTFDEFVVGFGSLKYEQHLWQEHGLPLDMYRRLKAQFVRYDTDHSGEMDVRELRHFLGLGPEVSEYQLAQFARQLDKDNSGAVSFAELIPFISQLVRQQMMTVQPPPSYAPPPGYGYPPQGYPPQQPGYAYPQQQQQQPPPPPPQQAYPGYPPQQQQQQYPGYPTQSGYPPQGYPPPQQQQQQYPQQPPAAYTGYATAPPSGMPSAPPYAASAPPASVPTQPAGLPMQPPSAPVAQPQQQRLQEYAGKH